MSQENPYIATQEIKTNIAAILQENKFANPSGERFVGWNTARNGSGTSYANCARVVLDGNTTLYGQWGWQVTWNGNGGSTPSPSLVRTGSTIGTLPTSTRSGYTLNGWWTSASGGERITTSQVVLQDKIYYAQWNPVSYSITYNLDGGSVSSANPTSYTIETEAFTLNNPTWTNHYFKGWTGSNGTTPQTSVTISKGSIGDRTYTANWMSPMRIAYRMQSTNAIKYYYYNGTQWPNNSSITQDNPATLLKTWITDDDGNEFDDSRDTSSWSFNKNNIEELNVGTIITYLGEKAFNNCTGLNKVTLSSSIVQIQYRAFRNTAITNIEIPSSVTYIGEDAFASNSLTSITFKGKSLAQVQAMDNYSSWGLPRKCVIHCDNNETYTVP